MHKQIFPRCRQRICPWWSVSLFAGLLLVIFSGGVLAQSEEGEEEKPPETENQAIILDIQGTVEIMRKGTNQWEKAKVNQVIKNGDRLRTGLRSRAKLRLANKSVMPVNESTTLTFEEPEEPEKKTILNLNRGAIYFRHRDRSEQIPFRTRMVSGAIRGTEFALTADDDGRTVVTMIDGEVALENDFGSVVVTSGEQGVVEEGKAPAKSPALDTQKVIQWTLYYPGILDLNELGLEAEKESALARSLEFYRKGNLPAALDAAPFSESPPGTNKERIYFAGLLLSAGQVDQANALLEMIAADDSAAEVERRLSAALGRLIAAVQYENETANFEPTLASEWLAESYYRQSQDDLQAALSAARKATEIDPEFGFAWVRLAELEFSFGRTDDAISALKNGQGHAPENAQGVALRGFLEAAQNHISTAILYFDRAVELDGSLPTAWLGRGLCKIKKGRAEAGRMDLEVASALAPNRAIFRDYLGKAYSNEGEQELSLKELDLSQRLDPNDPTSWLYSALLEQQRNRVNQAVRDLQKSYELNENRRVYRSQMLLDQDRAVRGANLANIYKDAHMPEVSFREATRAVTSDYANYSAHLFLANSYDELRDPRQKNLRYETPWLSEFLISNLLAPVGAGTLSQNVSNNEYSKLLEKDKLGFASNTEYWSTGDWLQEATQYGTFGNTSYAVDLTYRNENGQQPNSDLEQWTVSAKVKQQLTPKDSIYLQGIYYDAEFGDVSQYYDPQRQANRNFRGEERQEPIFIGGYHHEWRPGMHTLVLASLMNDTQTITDPDQQILPLVREMDGSVSLIAQDLANFPFPTAPLNYQSEFNAASLEAQQIWQIEKNTLLVGGRFQDGGIHTRSDLGDSTPFKVGNESVVTPPGNASFDAQASSRDATTDLQRFSIYVYDNWRVVDSFILTAGLAYDYLDYPINFRSAPVSSGEDSKDQVSPKAGFTWTPWKHTTLRGAVTRSLGGVSFDQSFRLEPTQVAGFTQSYRNLMPESLVGSQTAPEFTTWGLALDQKFKSNTYITVSGEILKSETDASVGTVETVNSIPLSPFAPSPVGTPLDLEYEEKNLYVTVNQLIDANWSAGVRYRLTQSNLERNFLEIPPIVTPSAQADDSALFHQLNLYALFNHPSGFFGLIESVWTHQDNSDNRAGLKDEDFWQLNAFAGYRFYRRKAELSLGVLNLTDQDYRLDPLTPYQDLRRERTFTARFRFAF